MHFGLSEGVYPGGFKATVFRCISAVFLGSALRLGASPSAVNVRDLHDYLDPVDVAVLTLALPDIPRQQFMIYARSTVGDSPLSRSVEFRSPQVHDEAWFDLLRMNYSVTGDQVRIDRLVSSVARVQPAYRILRGEQTVKERQGVMDAVLFQRLAAWCTAHAQGRIPNEAGGLESPLTTLVRLVAPDPLPEKIVWGHETLSLPEDFSAERSNVGLNAELFDADALIGQTSTYVRVNMVFDSKHYHILELSYGKAQRQEPLKERDIRVLVDYDRPRVLDAKQADQVLLAIEEAKDRLRQDSRKR